VTGIEVFNWMKSQAVEHPEMSPSQIIRNRLQSVPRCVLPYLPKRVGIKRALKIQRQAEFRTDPQIIIELEDIP
jgi:hypothetical protein